MCLTQVHCLLRFVFTKVLPGNDSSTNTKKVQKDALSILGEIFL